MIIDIISDVCASLSKRMDKQINYIYGDSSYIRETLLSSWEKQGDSIGKIPNDRAVCSLRRGKG
mgnify:CR=1 FL=1